ncbi:hypothetical protein RHMOL_Rhmol03G0238200 [Rhododendron molle]|uniref:Uncharacterized protein n=1 Tax=Rhododendron molle TaxID=49168 RepID=A0ACC0PKW1_RHOML|nr:hypothetical protein RHMOL_Rhmol03G0238200 [Rhododendron molle]
MLNVKRGKKMGMQSKEQRWWRRCQKGCELQRRIGFVVIEELLKLFFGNIGLDSKVAYQPRLSSAVGFAKSYMVLLLRTRVMWTYMKWLGKKMFLVAMGPLLQKTPVVIYPAIGQLPILQHF